MGVELSQLVKCRSGWVRSDNGHKIYEEIILGEKNVGVEGPRSEDSQVAGFEVTIDKKYGMVRSDNKQQLWEEIIVRDKVVGAERSR